MKTKPKVHKIKKLGRTGIVTLKLNSGNWVVGFERQDELAEVLSKIDEIIDKLNKEL